MKRWHIYIVAVMVVCMIAVTIYTSLLNDPSNNDTDMAVGHAATASRDNTGLASNQTQKSTESKTDAKTPPSNVDSQVEAEAEEGGSIPTEESDWFYNSPLDQAYRTFEKDAEEGDARAQLFLYLILDECYGFMTESEITAAQVRGVMRPEDIDRHVQQSKRCQGLADLLGMNDFESLKKRWLEASAEGGSALAALIAGRSVVYEENDPGNATVRFSGSSSRASTLYDALEHSRDEPVLFAQALNQAVIYYNDLLERLPPDHFLSGTGRRTIGMDAWSLLTCRHTLACDAQDLESYLHKEYYEYEFSEILEKAAVYDQAIQDSDWQKLELE